MEVFSVSPSRGQIGGWSRSPIRRWIQLSVRHIGDSSSTRWIVLIQSHGSIRIAARVARSGMVERLLLIETRRPTVPYGTGEGAVCTVGRTVTIAGGTAVACSGHPSRGGGGMGHRGDLCVCFGVLGR